MHGIQQSKIASCSTLTTITLPLHLPHPTPPPPSIFLAIVFATFIERKRDEAKEVEKENEPVEYKFKPTGVNGAGFYPVFRQPVKLYSKLNEEEWKADLNKEQIQELEKMIDMTGKSEQEITRSATYSVLLRKDAGIIQRQLDNILKMR